MGMGSTKSQNEKPWEKDPGTGLDRCHELVMRGRIVM